MESIDKLEDKGTLFVISAPSGAGKTSLIARCLEDNPQLSVSVSHTTRSPRPGELDGENYHFVSKESFQALIEKGDFLESAIVFGNYYGTSQAEVEKQLKAGNDLILEIDWQGAQQVRKQFKKLVSIFILPPSLEILKQRLSDRGKDDQDVIAERLAKAREEISHYSEFDYLVVNDEFETAAAQLNAIFMSMHILRKAHTSKTKRLLSKLLEPETYPPL